MGNNNIIKQLELSGLIGLIWKILFWIAVGHNRQGDFLSVKITDSAAIRATHTNIADVT
jgi:hypothetical protein